MKAKSVIDPTNEGKIGIIQPMKTRSARSEYDPTDKGKIANNYSSKRIYILKVLHEMFELRTIQIRS